MRAIEKAVNEQDARINKMLDLCSEILDIASISVSIEESSIIENAIEIIDLTIRNSPQLSTSIKNAA